MAPAENRVNRRSKALRGGFMKRAMLVTAAVVLGVVAIGPVADAGNQAGNIECTGAVEGGTVNNVIVPRGAVCYLNVTNVEGNVDVGEDSVLISACSTLAGNVTADRAADVVLTCSTIGGHVHVMRGGEGFLGDSTVTGDVVFAENDGTVEIEDSVILGSLRAQRNTGGLRIQHSRIHSDLQCSQNNPRPTGGDNEVGGTRSGQCRRI
jgi:hypothetical protein